MHRFGMNQVVRRLRRRDEEGSALVLALFFAFIFSLLVTAILTFTDTGLRASKAYRAKRLAAIGPETAMESAIQRRLTGEECDDSTHSPLYADGDPIGGTDLVVRCQNLLSTSDDPPTGSSSTPRTALLALGGDSTEGIVSGTNLRVRGKVFSKSQIQGGSGLVVEGGVSAAGACPNVMTDTNPSITVACDGVSPPYDPVEGRDPDFSKSTSAVPVRRTVPACTDGKGEDGWLITLPPGYYDDASTATGLSRLTNGGPDCVDKVVWMQPGTYYFDFGHLGGAATTWSVTDPTVHVVGGDARGWDSELLPDSVVPDSATTNGSPTVTTTTPTAFTAADVGRSVSGGTIPAGSRIASVTDPQTVEVTLPPTADESGITLTVADPRPDPDLSAPGSCLGTGDTGYNRGVEVVVGGNSRIDLADGRMEVCAPPRDDEQHIALYGMGAERAVHTLEPTTVGPLSGFDEATASRAFVPGELVDATTDVTLAAGGSTSASLSLGTFRQSIPDNAIIDSAILRVKHSETGDVGFVRVTPAGCSDETQTLTVNPTVDEDTIDLIDACELDDPTEYDDLSVDFEVTRGPGTVDARLDAIVIDIAYRVPTTRKPTVATSAEFLDPANAKEIGEQPDAPDNAARVLNALTPSASLALTGFADPPVPGDAVIESAVLRVAHSELVPDLVETSVKATFPSSICDPPISGAAQPLGSSTTSTEDTLDLVTVCGLSAPGELAGLTVTYTAALTAGGTAEVRLDGVWLDLVYSQGRSPDSSVGGDFATNEASGASINGTSAIADLTGGADTATIVVDGDWDTAIPGDAIIDTARLRIRHRDDGDITVAGGGSVSVTPLITGGSTCGAVALPVRREVLVNDFVDLKACGLDNLPPGDLANLAVQYDVVTDTTGGAATAYLDGMELLLTYRPHTTRAPGTANGSPQFTDSNNALGVGGGVALGNLAVSATPPPDDGSGTLTLSGFDTPPLPAGSRVESATLRVFHQEDVTQDDGGAAVSAAITASFPGVGGTCVGAGETLPVSNGGLAEDPVNLFACGLEQPAALEGLSVTYKADFAGLGTAEVRVDAMVLDIVFVPPAFTPLSDCHITIPYPTNGGSCALVKTLPGTTARFVVNGTIYAPSAALDLAMAGIDGAAITRGAIARTIKFDITSVSSRPVIGVPPESVLFTVYPSLPQHQAASATSGQFGDPNNAKQVNESASSAVTLTGGVGGTVTASLTLSDFHLPALEPNVRFDAAILRVLHLEDPVTGDPPTLELDVDFDDETAPCDAPIPASPNVDIGPCGLDDPAQLTSLQVTFRATIPDTLGNSATITLDGIVLDLYAGPMLRAQVTFQGGRATVEGWSDLA